MSFDKMIKNLLVRFFGSQSLWNRAMSFDGLEAQASDDYLRLNPFGTGQCLSTLRKLKH